MTINGFTELISTMMEHNRDLAGFEAEVGDYKNASMYQEKAFILHDILDLLVNKERYEKMREIFKLGKDEEKC